MNAHGRILLDTVVSMGVASLALAVLVALATNISHTAIRVSHAHQGVIASTKTYAALSAAVRTRERNRLPFSVLISNAPRFSLPNGTTHPLKSLTGSSRPREASETISLIDVAHRYRGTVLEAKVSNSNINAKVCNLASYPATDEFKSFLLYSVDAVHQIVGTVSPLSQSCIEIGGTTISGLVTSERSFRSIPTVFIPVEREYSLFVDTTGIFRIASHVGTRITENQPIVQGIESVRIAEIPHAHGVSTFTFRIKPNSGQELISFLTPGLAQRSIWSEVLQ